VESKPEKYQNGQLNGSQSPRKKVARSQKNTDWLERINKMLAETETKEKILRREL
jgi:hypothetical protein